MPQTGSMWPQPWHTVPWESPLHMTNQTTGCCRTKCHFSHRRKG